MKAVPFLLYIVICFLLGCDNPETQQSRPNCANSRCDGSVNEAGADWGDRVNAKSIDQLVQEYEQGNIDLDRLRTALRELPESEHDTKLNGRVASSVFLPAGSYRVEGQLQIPSDVSLILDAGIDLTLLSGASIVVEGRLYALGSEIEPSLIHGSETALYQEITLKGWRCELHDTHLSYGEVLLQIQNTHQHVVRISHSVFDYWKEQAMTFESADGLLVDQSAFGLYTDQDYDHGEAIYGNRSAVIIQNSRFGIAFGYRDAIDLTDCVEGHFPIIRNNHFAGGEDDAIDLDNCTAIVAGNTIENFYPRDLKQKIKGINGGGITGDRYSEPVLINNLIRNCYHGIGFKNGTRPIIVHNTILDCNIGVTLYQGTVDAPQPHAEMFNNLLWNNNDWLTGESHTIVLNGKWWPTYNQEDEIQATISATHNLLGSAWEGEGNLVADPRLESDSELPIPSAESPALDRGLKQGFDFGVFDLDQLTPYLAEDYLRQPRQIEKGVLLAPDCGAIERQP